MPTVAVRDWSSGDEYKVAATNEGDGSGGHAPVIIEFERSSYYEDRVEVTLATGSTKTTVQMDVESLKSLVEAGQRALFWVAPKKEDK